VKKLSIVRFKVFMAVTILMMMFWVKSSKPIFSPEDGDSILLQNVGFYQPVHMVT
jgi:hypothetical protein